MIRKNKLIFNPQVVIITILSTLLLLVEFYHVFTEKYLDRFFLYMVIPILIIFLLFKKKPSQFGFQLGDWKAGLVITVGSIILIAPILWFTVHLDPEMQHYYMLLDKPGLAYRLALELFAWEFFFRGFILFGYYEEFGDHALWLQSVPFAMAHVTKPEIETLSTIFGGFLFGLVARRTGSFVYPYLIHCFISLFVVFCARFSG